jgi:hypothetical protein
MAQRLDAAHRIRATTVLTVGVPLAVLLVLVGGGAHLAERTLELLLAGAFVAAVARRPAAGFIGLLVWQPVSIIALSLLFRAGVPAPMVHGLGGVRDLVVIGVVVAAVARRDKPPLDTLDKLALGLVLLVSAYLLLPYLGPGVFARTTPYVRALAWRPDAEYLVLFLALRRVGLPARTLRAATTATIGIAVVVAAGALVEFFASSWWNSFLVSVVQLPAYKIQVLHVAANPTDVLTHGSIAGHAIVRVGSVLQSPLSLGFYLYAAWALSLRMFSGRRPRPAVVVSTVAIAAAIAVTLTRSAVLGAVVVAWAAFAVAASRRSAGRVRLGFVLAAAAVLFAPLAGSTALVQRTSQAVQGTDPSAQGHLASLRTGVETLVHHPLGEGLGTQPDIGRRFAVSGTVTSEDYYLGLGVELGVLATVLFVGTLVTLLRALRRRSRCPGQVGSFAAAMWCAGWGLAVGALFLHVWLDVTLALTFWGLAALALNDRWTDAS